jgi:hypothetical protein
MIRFLLQKRYGSCDIGAGKEVLIQHYSIEASLPELEKAICDGGWDQHEFEHHVLLGVEIFKEDAQEAGE